MSENVKGSSNVSAEKPTLEMPASKGENSPKGNGNRASPQKGNGQQPAKEQEIITTPKNSDGNQNIAAQSPIEANENADEAENKPKKRRRVRRSKKKKAGDANDGPDTASVSGEEEVESPSKPVKQAESTPAQKNNQQQNSGNKKSSGAPNTAKNQDTPAKDTQKNKQKDNGNKARSPSPAEQNKKSAATQQEAPQSKGGQKGKNKKGNNEDSTASAKQGNQPSPQNPQNNESKKGKNKNKENNATLPSQPQKVQTPQKNNNQKPGESSKGKETPAASNKQNNQANNKQQSKNNSNDAQATPAANKQNISTPSQATQKGKNQQNNSGKGNGSNTGAPNNQQTPTQKQGAQQSNVQNGKSQKGNNQGPVASNKQPNTGTSKKPNVSGGGQQMPGQKRTGSQSPPRKDKGKGRAVDDSNPSTPNVMERSTPLSAYMKNRPPPTVDRSLITPSHAAWKGGVNDNDGELFQNMIRSMYRNYDAHKYGDPSRRKSQEGSPIPGPSSTKGKGVAMEKDNGHPPLPASKTSGGKQPVPAALNQHPALKKTDGDNSNPFDKDANTGPRIISIRMPNDKTNNVAKPPSSGPSSGGQDTPTPFARTNNSEEKGKGVAHLAAPPQQPKPESSGSSQVPSSVPTPKQLGGSATPSSAKASSDAGPKRKVYHMEYTPAPLTDKQKAEIEAERAARPKDSGFLAASWGELELSPEQVRDVVCAKRRTDKQKVDSLQHNLERQSKLMVDKNEKLKEFSSRVQYLEGILDDYERRLTIQDDLEVRREEELAAMRQELEEARQASEKREYIIKSAEEDNSRMKDALARRASSLESMGKDKKSLSKQLAERDEELRSLRGELDHTSEQKSAQVSRIERLVSERDSLEVKLLNGPLQRENQSLGSQLKVSQAELAAANNSIRDLKVEIRSQKAELARRDEVERDSPAVATAEISTQTVEATTAVASTQTPHFTVHEASTQTTGVMSVEASAQTTRIDGHDASTQTMEAKTADASIQTPLDIQDASTQTECLVEVEETAVPHEVMDSQAHQRWNAILLAFLMLVWAAILLWGHKEDGAVWLRANEVTRRTLVGLRDRSFGPIPWLESLGYQLIVWVDADRVLLG